MLKFAGRKHTSAYFFKSYNHIINFIYLMNKFLLTLAASAVVSFSASAQTLTPPPVGTLVTNADFENGQNPFSNGTVITLQCLDTNGGLGWYLNGAHSKSETFGLENLYRVVTEGDRFKLQSVDNEAEYIGRASENSNALVTMVSSDNAETFQAAIATPTGWTTKPADIIGGTNTVRFTSSIGGQFLNTNNKNNTPQYFTGTGGYCVWYVYTLTDEEVNQLRSSIDVTLNFTGINGEMLSTTTTLYANADVNTALANNCPEFFVPSSVAESNSIVSATNNTFTVNGTWEYPFTLNHVFRADLRKSASNNCTKWTVTADGQVSTRDNGQVDDFIPENLFYLKDHGYNSDNRLLVTLHSLAYSDENGFECSSDNNSTGTFTSTPTVWVVKTNSNANATDKGISLQHSEAVNAHANDISGHLGVWNAAASQNDGGSFIRFFDLTDSDFATTSWVYDGETRELDATARAIAKENPTSENVREIFHPDGEPTEWYRMLNRETGAGREWSYLSYYPEAGETSWFIFNKSNGSRDSQIKSDFVSCGNFAGERTEATTEQTKGQLWAWVEGKGENAGKYCLVNKSNPRGAVSNVIVNNNGEVVTSGTAKNATRWLYVEDRKANADQVCWFTLNDSTVVSGATYIRPTFENPVTANGIYFALAAAGQNRQLIRISEDNEASAWWLMTPEYFDAVSEFDAAFNTHAAGFINMNAVIGGETHNAVAPNATTPATVETLTIDAVRPYAAKFNKKVVRVQNYRRYNTGHAQTWLGIADNNGSTAIDGIEPTTNGADLWLMLVNDEAKLTLRSLATGHDVAQATNATVCAGSIENTAMFLVGSQYMNLHQTNANISSWGDSNDTGSMWYVTLANDAFETPAAGEQYYRIVSDRWISESQSPNLAINGENREATGEGEVITRAPYGHVGTYWKLQAGASEGAVKLVNLVDEYAMGGDSQAVQQAEGNEYFIQTLNGYGHAIKSANATEGSIYLNVNANNQTVGLTNNGAEAPADNSNFSDAGAIFYFIPASSTEIANATQRYIDAVAGRIDQLIVDDSANIIALIGEEKAATYLETLENTLTIAKVNDAKRNGTKLTDDIVEAVEEIVNEHIGYQHIQFSTTKDGEDWGVFYLGLNEQNNVHGLTDKNNESALWTIIPAEDGFKLFNEQQQLFLGGKTGMNGNGQNGHYPLVSNENAATFIIGYNPKFASFYLCESPYVPQGDKAVLHLANNTGSVVNWNTGAGRNSHWYINALEDAQCTEPEVATEGVTFTLIGELTQMARDNNMVITVSQAEAPAESRRRAAAESHTVTVDDIQSDNTFTLPISDGKWKVSIPGGMLRTDNGLTRGSETVYDVKGTTGICDVNVEQPAAAKVIYDLQGRRLSAPVKGLNIVNGAKVLVK